MPGKKLIIAAQTACKEIALIAPFIKVDALAKVLSNIKETVFLRVIARWIPSEIAAGVCDIEIFDLISRRPNSELFVHPLLHAKLYRFDEVAFLGSANLTSKALGWAAPANIELLHAPKELLQELKVFETELMQSAIRVDDAYRNLVRTQVEKLKSEQLFPADCYVAETRQVKHTWLPTCRTPHGLWRVYSNAEGARRRMVESAFEAAQADLAALSIAGELAETQFNQYVAAILGQMPLIQQIDEASGKGISTEEAIVIIEQAVPGPELPYSPAEMWEVLKEWLEYFFPRRYRREPANEVFRRGRIMR